MSRAFAAIAGAVVLIAAASACGEASDPDASQTGPNEETIVEAGAGATTGELQVGIKPSIPVEAYWFGPGVGKAEAITARETRSHGSSFSYSVYYELPSAAGKTSAQPGKVPPPGEIRVMNIPIRAGVVRQTIARYQEGKHAPITLASGEQATFFPFPGPSEVGFAVVTKTTLIQVVGPGVTLLVEEERQAMAVRLRPL